MRVTKAQDRLNNVIISSSRIVIFGHENPDGDSIGSAVAMHHYLLWLGKSSHIVIHNRLPEYFNFLIPDGAVSYFKENPQECESYIADADLLIFLDMNGMNRSGGVFETISAVRRADVPAVLIDHHLNPQTEDFDIVVSDNEVSSACELLYQVLLEQPPIDGDLDKLPLECATAILTGILTDTNNFANSLFPSTYKAASALQRRGVDRDAIYKEVFQSYSEQRMRLMGYLLHENMRCLEQGVAYFTLSLADKDRFSFAPGDSEGFVNLPLAIKDIRMTAFFTEDNGFVKVSLRSKGNVDVNEFSHKYCNGGGHKNASGGRLYMPLAEVPRYFEEKVEEFFKK